MTAIAIAIHNFPEGLGTFLVSSQDLTLGITVALAIALHNIPEGIAVALPIYHATGKKISNLVLILDRYDRTNRGFDWFRIIIVVFAANVCRVLMAVVVGIMIYIAFDTLLPLSHEYGDWHYAIAGVMSGIIVIWASLLLLNA